MKWSQKVNIQFTQVDIHWSSSGKCFVELPGHHGRIYDAAWSPDDSMLVTASSDFTAKVWKIGTPIEPNATTVLQHCCFVYSCAFHPVSSESPYLVTGAYDGVIRIWNPKKSKVVDMLKVSFPVSSKLLY